MKGSEKMPKLLLRPNFVTYSDDGRLKELFCKICGSQIAGEQEVRRDTNTIVVKWARFSNYAEIKMACADGSAHVTNGCAKCLKSPLSNEMMAELLAADLVEQNDGKELPKKQIIEREPKKVVKLALGGRAAV